MRKTRLIILAAVLVLVAGFVIIQFIVSPRPGSVRYHVDRLNNLRPLFMDQPQLNSKGRPANLRDYFRFQTWRWYWRGGFSDTKLLKECQKHEQALLHLGYFERREFALTNRTMWSISELNTNGVLVVSRALLHDGNFSWWSIISNGVFVSPASWHIYGNRPYWIGVIARNEDMRLIERTVADLDRSK